MAAHVAFSVALLVLLVSTNVQSTTTETPDPDPDHRAVLAEEKLYKRLMTGYNKKVHPIFNRTTIKLQFGLALISLVGLNSEDQVLTTHLWARHTWQDFRLKWDPAEFDQVSELRMDVRDLWTPDLILYNSMEDREYRYVYDALAVVYNDGTVLWIPPMRAKSTCAMDFMLFPFDEQTCHLKFGSWTYDGHTLDVEFYDGLKQVDITDYIQSNHWILLKHDAKKNVKYYPCCNEPYPDLTFSIKLRRVTSYYRRLFIGPAALMAMLAPFMFMLPPGTGEKTTLGVGLLIILYLCIMMLDYYIGQEQSGNSVLGIFYYITFIMVALSTALSALVSNMAVRGPRTGAPPVWIKKIFVDLLGRLVCVNYSSTPYSHFNAEASSGDVNADTATIIKDASDGSSGAREYQLIAMVFDRLLFVASVLVFVLITIIMVAK